MTARYQYLNYDRSHACAELIFRMLMTRLHCRLGTYLRESKRRCPV